jgi:hypothetical protein
MTHEFSDVRAHHLVPVNGGVQACACGVTYRNGLLYPPLGAAGVPYDREAAIEASLVDAGLTAAEKVMNDHGRSLYNGGDTE